MDAESLDFDKGIPIARGCLGSSTIFSHINETNISAVKKRRAGTEGKERGSLTV
tara:strand:- start:372 stop:533 length:162 start_codon:yes stop_codon:yes gene_type:complete